MQPSTEARLAGEAPGRPTANDDVPTRVYHARDISVEWYSHRCIHSGRCVRALPRVFNPGRRPWIDVHAAGSEEVAQAVLGCPSGALWLVRHPEQEPEPASGHGES